MRIAKYFTKISFKNRIESLPRPYLDYYGNIYDEASNAYFHQNLYHKILALL